ncbi:MAG: hypothetical protein WC584_03340 [Candidatus Pacearchaeota archaeon]
MGLLDSITQMKSQGMTDSEIAISLREQGVTPRQIDDALNQSQIKSAVVGEYQEPENLSGEDYIPSPQQQYQPQTQEISQNYYPQQSYQEYYPQQNYENAGADYSPAYNSTDSMMDIAEQVFEEKTKKMQKQIDNFEQFKNIAVIQMQNISDRLKRIEDSFDKLQIAVVEKVGNYGKDLSSLKKEVAMVEDSFGKLAKSKTESSHETHEKKRK